jgi:alkanesulfonate monooxygenase SsuD/methylene tetrahydromethanopterin reductase-like flavin-dependent oxidoreductase (luciferase family)
MSPRPSEVPRPALSLVGSPGRRRAILDVAVEAEDRGFPGIACPTLGGAIGLCVSLAHLTRSITFFTSIQGIYGIHPGEMAGLASHIGEMSEGRFRLGLGVSHEPMVKRLDAVMGPPLSDTRSYVERLRQQARYSGDQPPIYLAALRDRMLDLAVEIADGALWANSSLRYTADQVARIRGQLRPDFYLGVMVPTVISDDRDAARAVHRKTLTTYVRLPNYRNYWRAAGYIDEMDAVEAALERGDRDGLAACMSDTWVDDCTVSGSRDQVHERFAEWRSIGVEPIAVMSSTSGGQLTAVRELFDSYT